MLYMDVRGVAMLLRFKDFVVYKKLFSLNFDIEFLSKFIQEI